MRRHAASRTGHPRFEPSTRHPRQHTRRPDDATCISGRRRCRHPRGARDAPDGHGFRRHGHARRAGGAGRGRGRALRPGAARPPHGADGRRPPDGEPARAPAAAARAHHDRARHDRDGGGRRAARRLRLPHQAVRPRRAAGQDRPRAGHAALGPRPRAAPGRGPDARVVRRDGARARRGGAGDGGDDGGRALRRLPAAAGTLAADGERRLAAALVAGPRDGGPRGHGQGRAHDVPRYRDRRDRGGAAARAARARGRAGHRGALAALGRMATQVAHELKNPLAGLRLYARHLEQRLAKTGDGDGASLAQKISGTVDHLAAVVSEITAFGRPPELHRAPVALHALLDECVSFAQARITTEGIEIFRIYDPTAPPQAMLDARELRKAFLNLLLNGLESLAPGGRLTVTTAWAADTRALTVTIEDTGGGMPDETLSRIFDLFFTTKPQGTGLGMAIARSVIDLHGGELSVHSVVGQGTRVVARLTIEPVRRHAEGKDS